MRITSLFVRVMALVFVLGALGNSTRAQNVGTIQGQVTDSTGAVVVKASVEATDISNNVTRKTQTDGTGSYAFSQLTPGTYRVKISKDGFKTSVQEDVRVLVSSETHLDVRLEVGTVSQEVRVQAASSPQINTTDATVGNFFGEKDVKTLPFEARNVVTLLTIQPGVVFTGTSDFRQYQLGVIQSLDARDGAVDGIRGNQTNVTLDGVDANDWQNQAPFTSAVPVTLDSMQEFRVTTTSANATEGLVGGPQVTLVTKSGSNDFHGNARWYYRTAGPTADNFFDNASGQGKPKLVRNIAGGSLGGPIKRDRAYFFLDDEELREAFAQPVGPRSVPSDALRNGVLIYACKDPAACPATTVSGQAVPAGAFGLTPANIKQLDPSGLGINSAMTTYMGLLPHGNDSRDARDGGLAFDGLRFNAPEQTLSNVYTARLDFNITHNGRHTIFARGSLEGVKATLTPAQFPGESASSTLLNNSRGIVVQYQGQITPNFINTARWGFIREGVAQTGTAGPQLGFRSFTDILNFGARTVERQVPVEVVNDDIAWTHGKHNLQFGGVVRWIRNHRLDDALSFPSFFANDGFCVHLCRDAFNALANDGFPAGSDGNSFTRAFMILTGSITQVNATFFATPQGKFLQPGSPELRTFAENNFETYVQDSWKIRSNLTITAGLRYSYETPPWEVNGSQVAPTIDIGAWFRQRVQFMNAGIPSSASPLLSWGLAGKANGQNSWFKPDYRNFAPRVALAYSPQFDQSFGKMLFGTRGQSSIRIGAGIYYDRIGQVIAVDSDLNGSPGTATALIDPSQLFCLGSAGCQTGSIPAPRFSGSCTSLGCSGFPALTNFFTPPTSATFPFTPVANTSNLGFAVDPNLRTPYSVHMTISFQRQLPKNFFLDFAYVGTLGRRLLGKVDFAQYLDIRDPKTHVDLFTAMQQIAKFANLRANGVPAIDPNNISQLKAIPDIAFFNNMLPNMPAFADAAFPGSGYAGLSPTQAFYAFAVNNSLASWSCSLFPMDTFVGPGGLPSPWNTTVDPNGTGFVLFTPQFSTLPGWTNFASSNYHSMQVLVRKNVGWTTFGFNYVLSRSIDNDSSAENADFASGGGTLTGLIQNPFNLRSGRGLSDFQLKHNFSGNFTMDLPFGHGHSRGADANGFLNALIGGWEVTGIARWHSGFPLSVGNGFNFPTNFFLTTPGTFTSAVKTSVARNEQCGAPCKALGLNGHPNLFGNSVAALDNFAFTLPGASGSRNSINGPGFATFDAGVYKTIQMPWSEQQRLRFIVTAFNVLNGVNFDDGFIRLDPTSPKTFGNITNTAQGSGQRGGARELEFGARFEF
ncbi:MAG: carboxypeptidase regulatory-like domain-containing protein [Candidatus Acidiferrales bacterium]